MPPEAPLPHPHQDFAAAHRDANAPVFRIRRSLWLWRAMVLLAALVTTVAVSLALGNWLGTEGLGPIERVLILLVSFTFFWICFGVATATLGLVAHRQAIALTDENPERGLGVALLVPVYNEPVGDVMGNVVAMLHDLADLGSPHRFEMFVLSDTRDPAKQAAEEAAIARLRGRTPLPLWYRRRRANTDRKTGNIGDWVTRWGGGYEAMIVLDADSLMSAEALDQLTDEMARDPSSGLIQSLPRLIGARSLFARLQQFSSAAYGWLLAEGLATWAGPEGNYWGHNAIIRTRAFADCAGLPRLPSRKGEGSLIMSHDFVEAGLLRRAGWAVRFLPNIPGSYEESPESLVDYALRDRRWCHGNLQHLRLLRARGFHLVSRFHMFAGAMAYLTSPAWFALLVIWALMGNGEDANVITYFTPDNPLRPNWPEMTGPQGLAMLVFMYAMLLAPKIMAAGTLAFTAGFRAWGGAARFWASFTLEILSAIILAPILMIQQLVAVVRAMGGGTDWSPTRGGDGRPGLRTLLRFHWIETTLGVFLTWGFFAGLISPWLIPIAGSLLLAVPLSWFSAREVPAGWLAIPEDAEVPKIVAMSREWRERIAGGRIAAE